MGDVMNVYVLTLEPYHENSTLGGVYSTLEAAKAAADAMPSGEEVAKVAVTTVDEAFNPDDEKSWVYSRRIAHSWF